MTGFGVGMVNVGEASRFGGDDEVMCEVVSRPPQRSCEG
jgi:hypothetical protein